MSTAVYRERIDSFMVLFEQSTILSSLYVAREVRAGNGPIETFAAMEREKCPSERASSRGALEGCPSWRSRSKKEHGQGAR
jgi:hypothetical protein